MKDKCIILGRVSTLIQSIILQTEAKKKQAIADGYKNIIVIEDKESAVKLDEVSRLGHTRFKNTTPSNQLLCIRVVANRLQTRSELKHSQLAA